MVINIGSLLRDKEISGNCINDRGVHVVIAKESNVTPNKISEAAMQDFAITTSSCREGNNTRGGGGGSRFMSITACLVSREKDQDARLRVEMKSCSTKPFPKLQFWAGVHCGRWL